MPQPVFHYDPVTFFYLGSSLADESPLEPGVFLVPAHATTVEPPAQFPTGTLPKWFGSMWAAVELPKEPSVRVKPLTARRLRLGLIDHGILPADVDAVIDQMPAGIDREKARVEWEYAEKYERQHPLIAAIGAALELTDGQIDAMWAIAEQL